MNEAVIRVENISKRYKISLRQRHNTLRDHIAYSMKRFITSNWQKDNGSEDLIWALKDVSFDVHQGEGVGVIGRNGAGKSTLLKILTRVTWPTRGRAEVRGRLGSLLEVGSGFHPELTGRENISLNGAIMGMSRSEVRRKFDEIVSFAGVEKFIDTPVKRYSSGMYVKLAFAVAAHLEPDILLIDEVLSVGDFAFQKKCFQKIHEVQREQGRTFLVVSHSMGSIKQLCRRSILLHDGEVRFDGDTDEAINLYLHEGYEEAGTEYLWSQGDSPGNDSIKLSSIRLCSESGEARSNFSADEPVCVEVQYKMERKQQSFRIGISLYTSGGTYVLYSSDRDSYSAMYRDEEPGEYVSRCEIPANFLNLGGYVIVVSGDEFGADMILQGLPRLKFDVSLPGSALNRLSEARQGIVCPLLQWEVRRRAETSR